MVNGLRFFYHTTLKRDRTTFTIPSPRQSGKLPVVLSREEVQQLLSQTTTQQYRTMLMVIYAAGLRLTEVLHLHVHDVDAARMTIRVTQGKGGQDRDTILSVRLLDALRAYWRVARPTDWCAILRTGTSEVFDAILDIGECGPRANSTPHGLRGRLANDVPHSASQNIADDLRNGVLAGPLSVV